VQALLVLAIQVRAGFSWWGAWGPAIGVGDGGRGFPASNPKNNPRNIFFSQT